MKPQGGKFVSKMYVELKSPTNDPIFYTTDGSMPSERSTLYGAEIELSAAMAHDGVVTVQAVVCGHGKAASEVTAGSFRLMLPGALLEAASAAVQQGRSLLDAARRLNLGEGLEEEAARELQAMLRPYLARLAVRRRRRAIVRLQSWARMLAARRAVRRRLERKRHLDPDGRLSCLVVRIRLKGERAGQLEAAGGGRRLCRALASALDMAEGAWLLLSLTDYTPTATAEHQHVPHVKAALMAFPPKSRLKHLSVAVKEALAQGGLQAALEAEGMQVKTAYREPEAGRPKPIKTDWRRVYAKNGKVYFWNKRSGETSWKVPPALASADLETVPLAAKNKA